MSTSIPRDDSIPPDSAGKVGGRGSLSSKGANPQPATQARGGSSGKRRPGRRTLSPAADAARKERRAAKAQAKLAPRSTGHGLALSKPGASVARAALRVDAPPRLLVTGDVLDEEGLGNLVRLVKVIEECEADEARRQKSK